MSRTATVIISVDPRDDPTVGDLSIWLDTEAARSDDRIGGSAGSLVPMTDTLAAEAWGGHKTPGQGLWGGVTDHLDLAAFTTHLAGIEWKHPDRLQVLIKDEADPWFRVYMIRHGELTQHAPTPDPHHHELPW